MTFSNEAGDKSQFIATIEASSSGFKGTFNTAPADNVASFTKAFDASTYKSLKAFIDDKAKITVTGATLTCGNAEPDATAQPLPAKLEWYHSERRLHSFARRSRVFHDENCAAHFTTAPAEMPYEKTKCTGASTLTFYWMAMHGPTWQLGYYHRLFFWRVPGGPNAVIWRLSVNSTTGSSSADTPSVTPAPASGSSPSVTPAPASGGSPSTPSTNTSPSTSTTSAPSTSTTDESDWVRTMSREATRIADRTTSLAEALTRVKTRRRQAQWQHVPAEAQQSLAVTPTSKARQHRRKHQEVVEYRRKQPVVELGAGSQQNPYQGTGTGSQNSFDFNTFQGTTNAGTVAPQYM
ncbi:hypothetical protein GQ600_21931 [Phytophthora cactorum]|nr:hypothetical protein GQ600_21931 [Phytophthora cactorum]